MNLGRGGGTRTPGPMVPNHVRYQTALHLEDFSLNYIFYFISGRGGGTRTPGARFWRPTLYQLSYTPIKFGGPSGTRTPDLPVMSRAL